MPEGFGAGTLLAPGFLKAGDQDRDTKLSKVVKYVHADLEFQGKPFKDVAVRYKGNSTCMMAGPLKRSLKVDLNDFVKGQKLAGLTKLNFADNVSDPSWMNESVALRRFRDAGVPAPRTTYARVFVTVPGKHDKQHFGLYCMVENVDDNFTSERFGSKKGALFKPGTRSPNSAPVLARSFLSAAVVQASDFRAEARLGSETGNVE